MIICTAFIATLFLNERFVFQAYLKTLIFYVLTKLTIIVKKIYCQQFIARVCCSLFQLNFSSWSRFLSPLHSAHFPTIRNVCHINSFANTPPSPPAFSPPPQYTEGKDENGRLVVKSPDQQEGRDENGRLVVRSLGIVRAKPEDETREEQANSIPR